MSARPVFQLARASLPTGRLAIEASAGTGKTYTLAGLAVRYVAEEGIPVAELLVVTFTRAAAAELRDRIRARLVEAAAVLRGDQPAPADDELLAHLAAQDPDQRSERLETAISQFDAATITTIHGFAQQVLTTLGSAAPGDLDAILVDDADDLIPEICADVLAAEAVADPGVVAELPSKIQLSQLVLQAAGNPGIALVPGPDPDDSTPDGARRRRLVDRALAALHRRRRDAGSISFDDSLTQLRDALRSAPAAAASLRRRYRVALIDEFQDTDPVQWQIFSTLFGGAASDTALVLVGDPKQAIYAFRGANVHTYLEAAYEPGTERSTLATNWRSDQALLRALERLLDGATFGDPRISFVDVAAAPAHVDRRLRSGDGTALPALHVRTALDDGLGRASGAARPVFTGEAEHAIADDLAIQVQALLEHAHLPAEADRNREEQRLRPRDIAVLVGTHAEAAMMQRALLRRGIPALAHRGGSVLDSPAARQWRWLLTALMRPSDATRARTAALSWFFGWPADRVDAASDDELAEVQERLYAWATVLETSGTVDFCAHLWSDSEVAARVLAAPDGDRNLTDLDHLAQLLQSRASGHRPGAVGLLADLQLLEEANAIEPENDVTARRIESEAEAVQVMTIYAAKGLEFPVVCVPTLWRNSFAIAKSCIYQDPVTGRRTFDLTNGGRWPSQKEAEARKRLAADEALGENLRLLYVALTRAQHQTIVWWTRASGSDVTGLARLLFARGADGQLDPECFALDKVPMPEDAAAIAALRPTFAGLSDEVALHEIDRSTAPPPWRDDERPATPSVLELACLGRTLPRSWGRWSFSAISAQANALDVDPGDASLGDAGAADEAAVPDEVEPAVAAVTDLPLGAAPSGVVFGTMVHELLEAVDFAATDLDAELRARAHEQHRASPVPALSDEVLAGLRLAIESPLGPLFGGRRLADMRRADRLDELGFELRVGERGRHATVREIGELVVRHLPGDDPLRSWAELLADGLFDVELAGHLTGSIDVVFRVTDPKDPSAPDRFVLADYKTNLLTERHRLPQTADYHPDRLPAAMEEHHYPLQALLYSVAFHRYLRWHVPDYDPALHFGGAAYLFLRGMTGPDTPVADGRPYGVYGWRVPPVLVSELSDLLDGRLVTA